MQYNRRHRISSQSCPLVSRFELSIRYLRQLCLVIESMTSFTNREYKRLCNSDMQFLRYANCETDRHTDTFIAIIHSPLRGKLVTKYSVGMLFMTKKIIISMPICTRLAYKTLLMHAACFLSLCLIISATK